MKNTPHFGPASLDFHLNRPVISLIQLQNTPVKSLIQLHIVPRPLQLELWPPFAPHLSSARSHRPCSDRFLGTLFVPLSKVILHTLLCLVIDATQTFLLLALHTQRVRRYSAGNAL